MTDMNVPMHQARPVRARAAGLAQIFMLCLLCFGLGASASASPNYDPPSVAGADNVGSGDEKVKPADGAGKGSSEDPNSLIVGVRKDAGPFSFFEGTEKADRNDKADQQSDSAYGGYVVDICKTVFEAAFQDERVTFEAVTPGERFEKLINGEIQILCDPSTITAARLEHEDIQVSQPIYLSGVGIALFEGNQWVGHWPCRASVVGIVENTTAKDVLKRIAKREAFGPTFSTRVAQSADPGVAPALSDFDDPPNIARCNESAKAQGVKGYTDIVASTHVAPPVVKTYSNHSDLARAVCTGEVYYSVGDLEIIGAALMAYRDSAPGQKEPCEAKVLNRVYSTERYGIYTHLSDADTTRNRMVRKFMRQLSIEIHKGYESVLVKSFRKNLDAAKISNSLDQFFWNVISGN